MKHLVALFALALALAACRKKAQPNVQPDPPPGSPNESEIVDQLQDALSKYYLANVSSPTRFTAPKTLQELVTKGFLRKLPAAPSGRKIVYHPESWQVVIEAAK